MTALGRATHAAPESRAGAAGPIGLIAGGGGLPLLVAEGMRRAGHEVCCVGLAGQYDERLPALCDRFAPVGLFRPGAWARGLRRMGAAQAVMVGRVDKASLMHDPLRWVRRIPDWRALRIWYRRLRHDKRSSAVLAAVAEELALCGVELIDSTAHIQDHMAHEGVMTTRPPADAQSRDVDFAWPLLLEALRLDIGQSMAVCEQDVIAVEAVEGTDRMIARAGELCRKRPWCLLKAAKAGHDRRADMPTVGERTVRNVHAAGGRCIALAAGDVIIVDKARTLALADELGVAIVGMPAPA